MPLVWGNGRMLVGLLELHAKTRRGDLLEMARRLGDFLVGAEKHLGDPANFSKLGGAGACEAARATNGSTATAINTAITRMTLKAACSGLFMRLLRG